MAKKIYSVEIDTSAYTGEIFQADTIGECEEFTKCRGLLEDEDVGDVRVALLSVQGDGEMKCLKEYKCEKAYKVDEKQRAVPIIVYSEVTA
jgi:hypothetical protein